jgi:phosphoenolpyruvate synthase/pyruvate phosphate dikinase
LEKQLYFPQEIAWGIEKKKLFITHVKPLTHFVSEQKIKTPEHYLKTATKLYAYADDVTTMKEISVDYVDGYIILSGKEIQAKNKAEFIKILTPYLEKIAKQLYPRPVVYRIADLNQVVSYWELAVIKTLREKKILKNIWIMLPFIQTGDELHEVKKLINKEDLHRSPTCRFWMALEIPLHVIELEKFIEVGIDGVCINANNVSMLLRGTSTEQSALDDQTEANLWTYEKIIKTCHRYGISSSFCKQAISSKVIEKLLRLGISNISVIPDGVENTRKLISEAEKNIIQ